MAINIPNSITSVTTPFYTNKSYLRQYDPYGTYSISCINIETKTTTQTNAGSTIVLPNTFNKTLNKIAYQSYSCTPIPIDFSLIIEKYK